MYRKYLILILITYFLIINASYYWEEYTGVWAIPITLLFLFIFFILLFILLYQIFLVFKEKFKNKTRIWLSLFMTIILGLIFYYPSGIINFEKLGDKDLFIAQREGAANCITTLKLKKRDRFYSENICFGIEKTNGLYTVNSDTIIFKNQTSRSKIPYYQYAVVKKSNSQNQKILGDLVLYKDKNDTLPYTLFIIKNDLKK